MLEYTIFVTCGRCPSYSILSFDNIYECQNKLYDMVDLERERHRPYYVDNDFFNNEYPPTINGKIFCIKERDITEWKRYSKKTFNNNIIKFTNMS